MAESELKPDWKTATPEGAREQVQHAFKAMTLREKVCWMEEMEQVALRFRVRGEE
jgi:hypothetical protein